MDDERGSPPFPLSRVLTDPLMRGMPGRRSRITRHTSFVLRYLRRTFRRTADSSTPVETIAHIAKVWGAATRAFNTGRVDSLIRYISGLRHTVETQLEASDTQELTGETRILVRRAWAEVRKELHRRLEAIDERIDLADPESSPTSFYWMETSKEAGARTWDDESITHLAEEIRQVYGRLIWTRANLKFIALHIDELRWLADFGAGATTALLAVPSNRAIKQRLRRIDRGKAELDKHVARLMQTRAKPILIERLRSK